MPDNNSLKPGDSVVMVNCYEAKLKRNRGKIWTVASEPWKICNSEVVLLEGRAGGGFAVRYLKRVEEGVLN